MNWHCFEDNKRDNKKEKIWELIACDDVSTGEKICQEPKVGMIFLLHGHDS